MKHPMFYSIHKLNRSTISINHFHPYIISFFSSQELKIKSVQVGLTISSFIFGWDYLQCYLEFSGLTYQQYSSFHEKHCKGV